MTDHKTVIKLLKSSDTNIKKAWKLNKDDDTIFSGWDERESALGSSWNMEYEEGEEDDEYTKGTDIGKYRIKCLNCTKLTTYGTTYNCVEEDSPNTFSFYCGHCECITTICGECYRNSDKDTVGNLCILKENLYYTDLNGRVYKTTQFYHPMAPKVNIDFYYK